MHHVTVLAAAFALSGDERYAERAASHLRSWWAQNPFLSGVHWTSGIETGLRLISLGLGAPTLWTNGMGVAELFERNEVALAQIWWHQHYLASFRSRGSSANNHVIAEAAGLLVAASAFDWFAESPRWARARPHASSNRSWRGTRSRAASTARWRSNTTASSPTWRSSRAWRRIGPADPSPTSFWGLLYRMLDVVAATVDVKLRAPRYGDGDNGMALVLESRRGDGTLVRPPGHRRGAVRHARLGGRGSSRQ